MGGVGEFVQRTPLAALALLLLVAMIAARELGGLAHRVLTRRGMRAADADGTDEGYILSAVLGLLALLVAFTFSLALNRFEERRTLVVAEANALGTAWLRTSLVDAPAPLRTALRAYARERLAFGLSDGADEIAAEARADALQPQVWDQALAAVRPYRTTALAGLVLDPINQAFDLAGSRHAALAARLPATVLGALCLYALASAGVLGYAMSGAGARHRIASMVMFALVVLAISLILDLDRPRDGAIRVPQGAMTDALRAMGG